MELVIPGWQPCRSFRLMLLKRGASAPLLFPLSCFYLHVLHLMTRRDNPPERNLIMKKQSQMLSSIGMSYATMTGVDDSTSMGELMRISEKYPLVEWGFLYSPSQEGGGGRYPSLKTLHTFFQELPASVDVSLHFCGKGVTDLLDREQEATGLLKAIAQRNGRVQLNFNSKKRSISIDALSELFEEYPETEFITQLNSANLDIHEKIQPHYNHSLLFDSSGGQGILCGRWSAPIPGWHCGWAGGLGANNLLNELALIQKAATRHLFWIDMESSLRDGEDKFSTIEAERCLEKVMEYHVNIGSRYAETVSG